MSEMADLVDDVFVLSFQQAAVSDQFVKITAQKFAEYDFVLWKKKVRSFLTRTRFANNYRSFNSTL